MCVCVRVCVCVVDVYVCVCVCARALWVDGASGAGYAIASPEWIKKAVSGVYFFKFAFRTLLHTQDA